jgi:hypothetical protein
MTKSSAVAFGFLPDRLDIVAGDITISTKPTLLEDVEKVNQSRHVENGWIYSPSVRNRIFGLPKTHEIIHAGWQNHEHAHFHLWTLSFFMGMRLTSTEAGFVDSTPLKAHSLVEFVMLRSSLIEAICKIDCFWLLNNRKNHVIKPICSAIHFLFLAQRRNILQFEEYQLLYTSMDAIFKATVSLNSQNNQIPHSQRIDWLCKHLNVSVPHWASPKSPGGPFIARLRNELFHEGLFDGEPAGFRILTGSDAKIFLEMRNLICRILIALLGIKADAYLWSPIDTRQKMSIP